MIQSILMDVALLCVTKFNIGIEECIKVQSTNPVLQRGQEQNVKVEAILFQVEAGWPRTSPWVFPCDLVCSSGVWGRRQFLCSEHLLLCLTNSSSESDNLPSSYVSQVEHLALQFGKYFQTLSIRWSKIRKVLFCHCMRS